MMKCKITNKDIQPFMNFGDMPIANGLLKKMILKKNIFLRWKLVFQMNYHYFN